MIFGDGQNHQNQTFQRPYLPKKSWVENYFYAKIDTTLLLYLHQTFIFLQGHFYLLLHFFLTFMKNLFKKHPIFFPNVHSPNVALFDYVNWFRLATYFVWFIGADGQSMEESPERTSVTAFSIFASWERKNSEKKNDSMSKLIAVKAFLLMDINLSPWIE